MKVNKGTKSAAKDVIVHLIEGICPVIDTKPPTTPMNPSQKVEYHQFLFEDHTNLSITGMLVQYVLLVLFIISKSHLESGLTESLLLMRYTLTSYCYCTLRGNLCLMKYSCLKSCNSCHQSSGCEIYWFSFSLLYNVSLMY